MSVEKKLTRSASDKMLGGVCGGLGNYFGIDATLVRVAFAALVLVGAGSPLLLYLLLWIIMPVEGATRALGQTNALPVVDEAPARADEMPAAPTTVSEQSVNGHGSAAESTPAEQPTDASIPVA